MKFLTFVGTTPYGMAIELHIPSLRRSDELPHEILPWALPQLAWAQEKAVVVGHPSGTSSARPIAVSWVSSYASSAGATTYMPPLVIASRTSSSTLVPWARDCARTTRATCSFSNAKPMALASVIDFLG